MFVIDVLDNVGEVGAVGRCAFELGRYCESRGVCHDYRVHDWASLRVFLENAVERHACGLTTRSLRRLQMLNSDLNVLIYFVPVPLT